MNIEQDRELAYLKLKQEATDRIEGGKTFADDMNGNRFGMTFNAAESKDFVIRNGAMIMAKSTQQTITQTDKTVVAQAYDTSGNGGRKLVRLSNGTQVLVVKNGTTDARIYKSTDNWTTPGQLIHTISLNTMDISLSTDGKLIFILLTNATANQVGTRVIDENGTVISSPTIDTSLTAVGNCSLIINEAGTELHAAWASKNSTYPNSFNIRYVKGTINADGSVTWGSVEQVSLTNTTGVNVTSPSIVVNDGIPYIFSNFTHDLNQIAIIELTKKFTTKEYVDAGTGWGSKAVYYAGTYAQSSPSAIFIPKSINGLANGRIWVAWHGSDSTDTKSNIRISYSDDGGVTWSTMQKLTSVNAYDSKNVSITCNLKGEVFAVYEKYFAVYMVKFTSNKWGQRLLSKRELA